MEKLSWILKKALDEKLIEEEPYLSEDYGWWAFIKATLRVYLYGIAIIAAPIFRTFKFDSKTSRFYRFWSPDTLGEGYADTKTKHAKLFWVSMLTVSLLSAGYMGYKGFSFFLLWGLATGNLLGYSLSLIPALLVLPLIYLTVRDIGKFFAAWSQMHKEKLSVMRFWFFSLPKGKIRKE